MIEIINKENCCGCTACMAICPQNCITMKADEEGFLYPEVEKAKCIECKICEKVCPIINQKEEKIVEQKGYIVQNKDIQVLRESTAGGAFTAIAKSIIDKGGIVYGVEMDEDLIARHSYVKNAEELYKFRNSKYVQSYIGDAYKEVKSFLEQGKYVCFSGTPCQIEGLKSYLKKDYGNLITVDVVCRAVPSPLIFRKYVEYQEHVLGEKLKNVYFRDKHFGYKYSTMNLITDKNDGKYHRGVESDPWLRAFFSGICNRPSCQQCKFRKQYRISDLTIWDCFHIDRFSKKLDNDKGVTRVLIHSAKGKNLFEEIKSELEYVEIEPSMLVKGATEMRKSVCPNERRTVFFQDANEMDGYKLFSKYFPTTPRVLLESGVRTFFMKMGMYKYAKRIYVKLTKKY